MKVIFLDVDGVLNSSKTRERFHGLIGVDKEKLNLLLGLMQETGAKYVLSSTWRLDNEWIRELFRAGLPVEHLAGITPNLAYKKGIRGDEVAKWLRFNGHVESYVILDDDADFLPYQKEFLVKTSSFEGLTWEDVQHAKEVLNSNI